MSASLRIGLVGTGGIAGAHAQAWNDIGAELCVYSTGDNVETFANTVDATPISSLDQLVELCDVVDVCTPTPTHREIVEAASNGGCHVICEKPLALTVHDGLAMINACASAGVQLHPGQVVRYFPEYAAAKARIDAGDIGVLAVARLSRRGSRPAMDWFARPESSGGVIVDQMIHDIDFAQWIGGDVTTVFAKVVNYGDGLVNAYVVLTHESGAISHLHGAWGPEWTTFETSFVLSGTEGQLRHSSSERPAVRWDTPAADGEGRGALLPSMSASRSPFYAELSEFAESILTGKKPRVTALESVKALAVARAGNVSVESNRPEVPEALA